MKLQKITIANLEWNDWNGFILDIIGFETRHTARSLFAFYFLSKRIGIHILFIEFEISW